MLERVRNFIYCHEPCKKVKINIRNSCFNKKTIIIKINSENIERVDYLINKLIELDINLFAEQDKHLSKVNTMTQIVVQARLMLMKKLKEKHSFF